MEPMIIDKSTGAELWRIDDCAAFCDIRPSTWRTYYSTGRTPNPVIQWGGKPLWDAEEIKQWHSARPGSPGRTRHAEEASA